MRAKTFLLTALALASFAANSILCRLALADGEIDPAGFTLIRLVSGAVLLALLLRGSRSRRDEPPGGYGNQSNAGRAWLSGGLLFAYAGPFSFAYVGLSAGAGALILFGSVQATMLWVSIIRGDAPSPLQWLGLALALAGLANLVSPGLAAPPLISALLMAVAGIAWGIYSLRGQGEKNPIRSTAENFLFSVPFALTTALLLIAGLHASPNGALLAIASGALTSGLGYVLWYAALPKLGTTRAAIVQLVVPVMAAAGGVVLLGETFTGRLALSSIVILSGVGIALYGRHRSSV